MARNQAPAPRRRPQSKPPKPAKRGTPVRNSILLLIFAAVLVALVVILPNEPLGRNAATNMVGGTTGEAGEIVNLTLRISEVMASNKSAYPDDRGNYSDWLEIENTGQEPISLANIGLSDRDDRVLFIFPDIQLQGGGRIVVFCDDTNVAERDQPLHARFKISALGETLYLFDATSVVFDSVTVPAMPSDVSYALTPGGWITTEEFTPGYANTEAGYTEFRSAAVVSATGLVLNELLASNVTTIQDEDGEFSDWIELYNGGDQPIDLSYYVLSDDETNLTKWRFPTGATIAPGEYYLVFASGKDRPGGGSNRPHTNFKLAAEGETVILSDILLQTIDRVTYDNLGKDVSYGRTIGLEYGWEQFTQPTPGMPNNRQGELQMDAWMRARNPSTVYISEVLTSSDGVDTPYGVSSYDWIELYNAGDTAVDLSNWGLSDSVGRPRKWQFGGVSIPPGGYLLVFPSGLTESPTGSGAIHADFRLSALGEAVVLSDPQGNILDKLVVPKLERGNSYGRNFEQGGLFYYETPTAGAANSTTGFYGYAAKPTMSIPGQVTLKPVTVELSAPEGTHIRYTTNGDDPTETVGMDYEGPITISGTTVLRARGFAQGLKGSDIATETYFINIYPSLPVVSIVTDNDNMWNEETGIYAEGPNIVYEGSDFSDTATYGKKLAKDGNIEYFVDGVQVLNQGVELQLHGQFSINMAQKSFRVTARARYGSELLNYPFFEDRTLSAYPAVILRNGGQDGKYTRIIDLLQARIIDWTDTNLLTMAGTPILAYVNGEYWGHYNLRERINHRYLAEYYGWEDPEKVDLIKGNSSVLNGNFDNYEALITFVRANDLNDPEALQTVLDWIDVDNYFDYIIFQTYFANTDPGNIKFYRYREEGEKWRWIIFDMDWGLFDSRTNGLSVWLDPRGAGTNRFTNVLILKLLDVPEMLDKFLTRYGQLYQETLSDTDRILAEAQRMLGIIEPELTMHFNRWAGLTHILIDETFGYTPERAFSYWQERVSRMVRVLNRIPNLNWARIQEWFKLTDEQMISYFGEQPPIPEGYE